MKKKPAKKKIDTVEKLAGLVLQEFADLRGEMSTGFSRAERSLKEVERRIAALEMKVSGIDRRLDSEAMERLDIKSLFARLTKLEEEVFGK